VSVTENFREAADDVRTPELVTPMRWGLHLATATWIFGTSWMAYGAMRWVGWLAVLAFLGASFAGPFVGAAVARSNARTRGVAVDQTSH
jgi:hypothetical protein